MNNLLQRLQCSCLLIDTFLYPECFSLSLTISCQAGLRYKTKLIWFCWLKKICQMIQTILLTKHLWLLSDLCRYNLWKSMFSWKFIHNFKMYSSRALSPDVLNAFVNIFKSLWRHKCEKKLCTLQIHIQSHHMYYNLLCHKLFLSLSPALLTFITTDPVKGLIRQNRL